MDLSSLEKEMTIHSSMIAWNISWTEEPGGLQSLGLQGSDTTVTTTTTMETLSYSTGTSIQYSVMT